MRLPRLMIILFALVSSCSADVSPSMVASNREVNLDFFPLGLYEIYPGDFDGVKAAGFNMVHVYDWTQSLVEAEAYLEAAEVAGLKVRQNMPKDYLYAGAKFWIEWVTTLSAYDSLAFWYLPEEPIYQGHDHAAMARLYEIIKQYDPQQRPVATYFCTRNMEGWCDVVDIVMVGCYPEWMGEQPRACMKTWIDAARESCPSRIVVGVAPFFDGRDYGGPPGHPSPHEGRFDAYTYIIAGAKGLDWFEYRSHEDFPELWEAVKDIVIELNELGSVILSPDVPQTITISVISGPTQSPETYGQYVYDSIQILEKREGGETYLFTSNLATDLVVAEFSGLSPDAIAVDVLYEGRTIAVSAGSFRDSFAEADVHIYRAVASIK